MGLVSSIRVLYVDDDQAFTELSVDLLEEQAAIAEVVTETNADAALDRLAADRIDCVVSDFEMHGRDGLELLDAVRERDEHLPFVLFTGNGDESVASEALTAGATDYLQKGSGTEQFEVLANRIDNAVEQYETQRRAAELRRVRGLVSDVTQTLARAESRARLEREVCEIISDSDPYLFAWIGGIDPETKQIEPRAWAGIEKGYLEEVSVSVDPDDPAGQGPGGRAARKRRVAVSQHVASDPAFEEWRREARTRGYESVAAVPLEHDAELYGVLGVYADRPEAFDGDERALLSELGADIGHALHSLETRRSLRRERDRRSALFANAPHPLLAGAFGEGGDRFRVVEVNDAFETVFGAVADDERWATVGAEILPDGEMPSHETYADRLRAGESVSTKARRVTSDGPRQFLIDLIPYGTETTPADGWYTWYRDVSGQAERERRLERLHETTRRMIDADTPAEIATVATEAATDIVGIPMNGIHIYDEDVDGLVPAAVSEASRDVLDEPPVLDDGVAHEAFESGEPLVYEDVRIADDVYNEDTPIRAEMCLPLDDHGVLLVSATAVDAFDEADRTLAKVLAANVAQALDRTARERELRAQNDRLEEFTSIISHDLQNPMQIAMTRLELAQDESDSKHLPMAADAVDRMQSVVQDTLTLARQGQTVGETEQVSLATLATRSWSHVPTKTATLDVADDTTLSADPERTRQLFENLFRNAVEHGGEDVTVTVGALADDPGFYVADDGPGIPDGERDRVFETGYSTTDDGTGFGLRIVEHIAAAHGWTVAVTESDAGGARFEISGVE